MGGVCMEQNKRQVLGILGGLGPAASCYLYQMLIDHTPARKDQDHIDLVLSSRASTPDRTAFITGCTVFTLKSANMAVTKAPRKI